jgi:Ca2+:H+ antiporter
LGYIVLMSAAFIGSGGIIAGTAGSEVVAHRVGEPFATLVLALAVTVIETALIVLVILTIGRRRASCPARRRRAAVT